MLDALNQTARYSSASRATAPSTDHSSEHREWPIAQGMLSTDANEIRRYDIINTTQMNNAPLGGYFIGVGTSIDDLSL
jgi:hypothetical protein